MSIIRYCHAVLAKSAHNRLVKSIYGPELPEELLLAAEHGIVLHLEKLEQEGKVKKSSSEGQTLWQLA